MPKMVPYFNQPLMTELYLKNQNLTDSNIKEIVDLLRSFPTIKTVFLNGNQIGNDGAREFAANNKTVTIVDLGGNQIRDEGAKEFAAHNKVATEVDLRDNRIGDEGAKALGNCPTIISLSLEDNLIKKDVLAQVKISMQEKMEKAQKQFATTFYTLFARLKGNEMEDEMEIERNEDEMEIERNAEEVRKPRNHHAKKHVTNHNLHLT